MSRISILQQRNLGSTAKDLVSPADAGADLVVLRFGVAVRVKLGLRIKKFLDIRSFLVI